VKERHRDKSRQTLKNEDKHKHTDPVYLYTMEVNQNPYLRRKGVGVSLKRPRDANSIVVESSIDGSNYNNDPSSYPSRTSGTDPFSLQKSSIPQRTAASLSTTTTTLRTMDGTTSTSSTPTINSTTMTTNTSVTISSTTGDTTSWKSSSGVDQGMEKLLLPVPPPLPSRPRIHNPYLKKSSTTPGTTMHPPPTPPPTHTRNHHHQQYRPTPNPLTPPQESSTLPGRLQKHYHNPNGNGDDKNSTKATSTKSTTLDPPPTTTSLPRHLRSSTNDDRTDGPTTPISAVPLHHATIPNDHPTMTGTLAATTRVPTTTTMTTTHPPTANNGRHETVKTPSTLHEGQHKKLLGPQPLPPPTPEALSPPQPQRPELPGESLLPPELVYDPAILLQPIKDEYRNQLSFHAHLNEPLRNGWTLFGHQKRAIAKGLMKRRLILALDMGLGKTLIGCAWAKAFQSTYPCLKVIIICPTTLVSEWKRTAETATGLKVESSTGHSKVQPSGSGPKKKKAKVTSTTTASTSTRAVFNDDNDEEASDTSLTDVCVTTWQKIPTSIDSRIQHYVVIFDEAHMMQSMEANRTQAALALVNQKDRRCVGTLLLTGTPMKNGKPSNLFPLLKAVQHPLGAHQRAFEKHFCEGRMIQRSFGGGGGAIPTWVANGQANLKQLHRLIEPKLLYMTKDEYLTSLPPMSQETRKVPVSASFQKQYMEKIKILANLKEAMKTNANLSSESLLGAMSEVRLVCALAKIHATTQIAREILEAEPSIVIFTTYQTCVQQMAKNLTDCGYLVAAITGQTSPKERQTLVDGFQV